MPWESCQTVSSVSFVCGYCGRYVASSLGWHLHNNSNIRIRICTHCDKPSYFDGGTQTPGVVSGNAVSSLPNDVLSLYDEARRCVSVKAFTASVLLCRKLLMSIAVSKGAGAGMKFIEYVEYLSSKGYVPPDGKGWVDHIRQRGNEATHEIALMTQGDATDLISFSEMLLKFIFEFPSRIPSASKS